MAKSQNTVALKITSKEFSDVAVAAVSKDLGTINPFALPGISKISINVGVGNKFDPKQKQEVGEYLEKLTGQKPKVILSSKSIAAFKLRKGDTVGLMVTLRGLKMYDFLLNLVYVALPRSRDFKGVKASFDANNSSYSLGLENANIFPAVGFDTSVNFGLQLNITFKQPTINNKLLLEKLNFPFKR
jgi:large subunit ribosomal protein L5